MREFLTSVYPVLIVISMFACSRNTDPTPPVTMIETPAGTSSHLPYLTANNRGELFMSWVETGDDDRVVLYYARLANGEWNSPEPIAEGDDWFVNWADYPSIAVKGTRPLAAHWLHKIPGNTYSYEINLSLAGDDTGGAWSPPLTPHRDATATEHGFVSMVPWDAASVLAVWLDGRQTAGRAEDEYSDLSKAMTIRSAVIGPEGSLTENHLIDDTVCDCCQTSLARTRSGAVAAYRNRTEGEIRDIYVSRYRDSAWTDPVPVHADGWQIGGCPVNGPKVTAHGETVLVAWFTGAGDAYKVQAAFSYDGGATFDEPVRIDGGDPIGRVDAAFLASGTAVVSWMEKKGDRADLNIRSLDPDGSKPGQTVTVSGMDQARRSGFPQMEVAGGRLYLAWTETGEQPHIRMAAVVPPAPGDR